MQHKVYYDSIFDKPNRMKPMIVFADLGNANLKLRAYRVTDYGDIEEREVIIPHGVVRLGYAELEKAKASSNLSRERTRNTHTFEMKVGDKFIPVQVGLGATRHPNNSPILGSLKYVSGGIDILLVAGLRQLFSEDELPKGHDNIILGIGHPPTEERHVSTMLEVLAPKGGHVVRELDGTQVKWRVRGTIPYDENIGGLMYLLTTLDDRNQLRDRNGKFMSNVLSAGDRILMFDAGGRKGSVGWIHYNGGTDFTAEYNTFEPIEGGIVTVRNDLRTQLTGTLDELMGVDKNNLTDEMMDEVLRTGRISVGGKNSEPIDVSEQINLSLSYLQQINSVLTRPGTNFDSGKLAHHIGLTGGTNVVLMDDICAQFNNSSFIPVAPLSEIVYANMRGGSVIVMSKLEKSQLLPIDFQKSLGRFYE